MKQPKTEENVEPAPASKDAGELVEDTAAVAKMPLVLMGAVAEG
jgi:hypothetical protein